MKTQIILVAALVLCGNSLVDASFLGNLESTLKIVHGLCRNDENRHSQSVIDAFFACYDEAPGKDLFVNCQINVFGGPMNTVPNVDTTCNQPARLPFYAGCLATAFWKAGLDMDSAVETLNACQSEVLGVA